MYCKLFPLYILLFSSTTSAQHRRSETRRYIQPVRQRRFYHLKLVATDYPFQARSSSCCASKLRIPSQLAGQQTSVKWCPPGRISVLLRRESFRRCKNFVWFFLISLLIAFEYFLPLFQNKATLEGLVPGYGYKIKMSTSVVNGKIGWGKEVSVIVPAIASSNLSRFLGVQDPVD